MSKIMNLTGPVVGDGEGWIYDYLGIPAISPQGLDAQLKEMTLNESDDLIINISSNGGAVTAASQIYTTLKQMSNKVVINVTGMAASAASVITMAGDEVNISPTAQIMIHQASTVAGGNTDDLEHVSSMLSKTDESIAESYVQRTGMPMYKVLNMMRDETYLSARDAVALGFADQIMFSDTETVNSFGAGMLPQDTINKIGTLLATKQQNTELQPVTQKNEQITDSRQAEITAKAAILLEGE